VSISDMNGTSFEGIDNPEKDDDAEHLEEQLNETFKEASVKPWRIRPMTARTGGQFPRTSTARPVTAPATLNNAAPSRRPLTRGKSGNEEDILNHLKGEAEKFRTM